MANGELFNHDDAVTEVAREPLSSRKVNATAKARAKQVLSYYGDTIRRANAADQAFREIMKSGADLTTVNEILNEMQSGSDDGNEEQALVVKQLKERVEGALAVIPKETAAANNPLPAPGPVIPEGPARHVRQVKL